MGVRPVLSAVLFFGLAAASSAQVPEGPGLGAERDTLALAGGQTSARLAPGIVPGSEAVWILRDTAFVALGPGAYALDARRGVLTLAAADSVRILAVAYRLLPRLAVVRAAVPRLDTLGLEGATPPPAVGDSAAASGVGIRSRGSITRGVVAGSNRDVSVTSGLRLELSGAVAPGVGVRAALTDEDTPILPEGSTQQLSDLDRVYVELDAGRARARLGDIDLALTGTTFAPLTRKVQGASVEAEVPGVGLVAGGRVLASGSATRGVFRSQDLVAREAVQGPYRLSGRQGETFVLVVPGSERVFLDGERLVRGVAGGYTIDYGTGEVTFTTAHLITAERRITVDFEYTTGGFTRTLLASSATVDLWPGASGPRAGVGARYLREGDAASFASDLGLSASDLDALRAAGDRDVLVDGATRVAFDPESPFVLYTRRDTTRDGAAVSIFVPATPASAEVFRVRFTRVAPGTGSYRRAGQAQNGVLYEYAPGGDYEPGRLLPRPARRQLLDLTGRVALVPGVEAFGEWARSLDDANTLSPRDDADDGGGAVEAGLRFDRPLGGGVLRGEVVRRARSDAFRSLDRVRDVEFNRRWNLARAGTPFGSVLDSLGEDVTEGRLGWALDEHVAVEGEGGRLELGGYAASRVGATLRVGRGGAGPGGLPSLAYRLDASESGGDGPLADRLGGGVFARQRLDLARRLGAWTPTVRVTQERRRVGGGALPQDTLLAASYAFWGVRPGVELAAGPLAAGVGVEWRAESEPLGPAGTAADLADAARSLGVEAEAAWRPGGSASADGRLAYRRRTYRDAFRPLGRQDAESVALRLAARAAPLARAVETQAVYEALTERSPVLQETYVLVGADLGTFVWRDGAGEARAGEPDGVAQVDEFFPETTPLEGTYLRTFIPSDELFPTVGVSGSLRLGLRPSRLDLGDGPVARALGALAFRTTLDVREKTREPDVFRVLAFDPSVLQGGGTLAGRFRVEQEVSLFPDAPTRGGRLAADHLSTTSSLAAGQETRLTQTLRAEAYGPLAAALDARVVAKAERRRARSESFASRTFDLRGLSAEPRVTWTPSERWALSGGAVVADRTDALAPATRPSGAFVLRTPVDVRLTLADRLALTVRAERSDVRLRGAGGTGLALFELTEGRGAGVAYLWGVSGEVGLSARLRATFTYDGRAPEGVPVIQTVRMQVQAVF